MFAVEGRGEVSEWNFSECIPSVFYIASGIAQSLRSEMPAAAEMLGGIHETLGLSELVRCLKEHI